MGDSVSIRSMKSTRKVGRRRRSQERRLRMEYSLYDSNGRRKYLVPLERDRFLQVALDVEGPTASFCAVLGLTGARLSEVLAFTPARIDEANSTINFSTLKQKNSRPTRAIPVPPKLLLLLDSVHHFRQAQSDPARANEKLWAWSRSTGWRRVKKVMRLASVPQFVAMPKALRHAFGVEATLENIGLTMVQRWLGHRDIKTTTIYTTVVGSEERALAKRMWRGFRPQK